MTLVFDLLNTIQSIDREIQADVEGNGEEEVLDVKNHIAEMKMSDLMDSPPILMSLSDKARKVVEKEEKKGDIGAKRTSSSQVVEFNSLDNSKFDFSVYFVKQQVKVEFPQKSSLSNTIEPISYLRISITLQLPQIPSETKISLKIPEEAAIFSSLILTCVRTYNNSQPKRPLVENSDAYVITVDGRAMSPFTKVRKILIGRNFVLKENTDYKKNAFEVPLSVSLPGGIIHTSTFSSTVRAVNVLLDICKRFNLEPTRHSITLDGKVLAPDVLLEKIQDGCVAIVERSLDQQSSGDVTSGDTFWFFHLAQKYKRYNVTHILKIGAKYKYQNATLGIDGEQVTQTLTIPTKRKIIQKQYTYLIRDIVNCRLNDDEDHVGYSQFMIQYRNNKVYTFETTTPEIAREIVGKIQYLRNPMLNRM